MSLINTPIWPLSCLNFEGREHEYYHIKDMMNRMVNIKPRPMMFIAWLCEYYNINVPYLQRYQKQFVDEFGEVSRIFVFSHFKSSII